MASLATLLSGIETEALDDVGSGRNELVFKCISGVHKAKQPEGEVIGNESSEGSQITVRIDNADLSKRHCHVRYDPQTASYFLQDLASESGTWVQTPALMFSPVQPETVVAIDEYEFLVQRGHQIDLLEEIFAKYSLTSILTDLQLRPSLDEFIKLDLERFQLDPAVKRNLKKAMAEAQTHSGGFTGLMFSTAHRHFQVGIRDLVVGSDSNCDVVLPSLQKRHAVIAYREACHMIAQLTYEGSVMMQLRPYEENVLQPGCLVRMGSVNFEVCRFNVGVCSEIGVRSSMEDTEVVIQNLGVCEDLPFSYFSVYDGHGGTACSQFLKDHLHVMLRDQLLKHSSLQFDLNSALTETFTQVFKTCDDDYLTAEPSKAHKAGSTAVICMIIGDKAVVANLGDSRAVLCRLGLAIDLSVDHKVVRYKQTCAEEAKRIVQNGGVIIGNRLQGRVALSRCFGDHEFKQVSTRELLGPNVTGPLISIEPELREIYLHPTQDEFILLACDGLFDVFSSQEAVNFIRKKLASMPITEQDPQRVVRELVHEAIYERKSKDNVTAMIVMLACDINAVSD